MVIGNGIIANEFKSYKDNDDILIFASGVSNSKETATSEFDREEVLLREVLDKYSQSKQIVYFSTCSVYDTYFERSLYTMHKLKMERIIIDCAVKYNIIRLPQVLGLNNKYQLIGFLYNSIKNKQKFNLFDIERNIIDISDVYIIVNYIISEFKYINSVQNVANLNNIKVIDLVHIIERICDKKAKYNLVKIKGDFVINTNMILEFIVKNKIFNEDYIEKRIRKYYE